MEALILAGGFACIAVMGFFVMGRPGKSLDQGGIRPYWDEEEEQTSGEAERITADIPGE